MMSLFSSHFPFRYLLMGSLMFSTLACQKFARPTENTSANLSTPSPNVPDYSSSQAADSRWRLAPRKVIASTLIEIFGDSVKTSVENLVLNEINNFGGSCDLYETPECKGQSSQAPLIPLATTARMGLTSRVCDLIVADDVAVLFAAKQALELATLPTAATLPMPEPKSLASAFDLFQPGYRPPEGLIDSLTEVSQSALSIPGSQGKIDAWRFTFLTLCLNSAWQFL